MYSADLDRYNHRVDIYALQQRVQLLADADVLSILFVWILATLEVDPVRKNGGGIKDKVDGVAKL